MEAHGALRVQFRGDYTVDRGDIVPRNVIHVLKFSENV